MKPPQAKKVQHNITIHGLTRNDPFFWLNQRDNPEVISYLEAENEYTRSKLDPVASLREELFAEMTSRISKDDESVPYLSNGYYYQTRYCGDAEYPQYYRWKVGDTGTGKENLLFDINEMAEGHSFYSDNYHYISPDNTIAAIGIDTVSRRNYTIRFKDLNSGVFLPDQIPMTTGSVAWGADSRTVFYTVKDSLTLRACKIYRHLLGTEISEDELIYEEKEESFSSSVYNSKGYHYVIIGSFSTMTTEYRILDADNPGGEFSLVEPRVRGHEYYIYPGSGKLYVRTNFRADNFKVMVTSLDKPAKKYWKDLITSHPDVLMEDLEVFDSYLVVQERFDGLPRFHVVDNLGQDYYISMDEENYVLDKSVNAELGSETFRFVYSSLTTPRSVMDFHLRKKTRKLLKEARVLGGFKKEHYETKRLFATARDGVRVPVTLVHRKGLKLDGNNPLLVYGYGSYGYSMDPWFRSSVISLLDRGFVYAIAHVRGGEEMGRQWYEDGKLLKKMNTFTDFISCTEFLIREKYSNPERLFALGGSAGGLLMGVISNLRPDLYKGIVATVPFVDVVTTMLDESIPLTTGEFDEWGNPKEKVYYDYMLSYSPYDQVTRQNYPNMLITTGFHDSQVQYWEPAKWVAKLRTLNTSDKMILLHTNMEFGHGGASGRFQIYKDIAMEYAFMLMLIPK